MTDKVQRDGTSSAYLPMAGFWRRLLAFFVDALLLGLVGFCLGLFFHDTFAGLGGWGRAIGFSIALGYFGMMNSRFCGGQTVGKLLMKLRVAGSDGKALGIGRSLLRSGVLCLSYFLNGAQVGEAILQTWFILVLSVLVFGVGLSIVYLFVFNRKTRQSLHDLLVGSYVVKAEPQGAATMVGSVWPGHYAVVTVILLAATAAPIFTGQLARTEPFASLLPLQKALASEPGIQHVTVTLGKQWSTSSTKGTQSQNNLFARVTTSERDADLDSMANRLARITLSNYPNASKQDMIAVSISYGYDIGIASAWQTRTYAMSPAQWRRHLELKSSGLQPTVTLATEPGVEPVGKPPMFQISGPKVFYFQ